MGFKLVVDDEVVYEFDVEAALVEALVFNSPAGAPIGGNHEVPVQFAQDSVSVSVRTKIEDNLEVLEYRKRLAKQEETAKKAPAAKKSAVEKVASKK